ncbi:iron ABC transporter substrate-binding protein [Brevirhabdus pacifica]|uniref:Iron ABC transporter substrate-binding protein n=1 Tax=Brevirhabdus pacifica TaxID=1267768 RepID=A0A1U7DLY4_9RHOB|nr:Fe(3+) ABC transporter substrate-binding protein [Brevirhabdus pacifica]APX90925.1 iron ABC transporter substrate-binding protein [Brevirhabdus pacifica]OWU80371.1 iron ABC transporter substrate-binding protein [Loktanella sp. 22II-4b]
MVRTLPFAALTLAAGMTANALQAEEVNVYSYRQPELIQPLLDGFTKQTGIDVNVAFLNKGLVERLEAEGARSPADVVLTVDISRLAALVDAGVTQPVESEILEKNVPAEFRDPGNQWFGLTTRARIVYASKERVKEGEITTYEDLADPKWKGRICSRSGTHAYNVALFAAGIEHMGEEKAQEWIEGIKANLARKPQGNDRAQVKAIWAGECDISLGNTYYMGKMLSDPEQKEWAEAVRLDFPVFEGGGTHVNVSGVAMTKSAPNRENAQKLMEYLASPEAQKIYATDNFEYPIAPDTQPDELVAGWGTFTADEVNLMDLARLRPDALRIVERVDFDG